MASYNKHYAFVENLAEGVHDLGSDTLRTLLTNTAPTAGDDTKSDLTEISAGNGYSAGGPQATISTSAQSSGTYKLVLADTVVTASGGSVGPFRYVDLYNDTPTSPADPLISWWDYGSSITLADGESFTTDFDGSAGVLTVA